MAVRVSGEDFGQLSFSSMSKFTLPSMQNLVIVEGCRMIPL